MTVSPALSLDLLETFSEGIDHGEGICRTPDGKLYVGGEAGQIYRVEPDGSPTELLRTDGFMLGLAADAEGRIYAIDSGHKRIWRIDPDTGACEVFADGIETPNWGAFAADGTYYVSDNGRWGACDGKLWRIQPGSQPEVWTKASHNFPNGLAVAGESDRLFVLESYPSALVEIPIEADGSAGERHVLCELGEIVPDGVALAEDGSCFISCYRPDAIFRWHPVDGLTTLAADPRGTVLAAPTNVVFIGEQLDEMVVPNLGRWHLTRLRPGVRGVPLHYPTREQLGS